MSRFRCHNSDFPAATEKKGRKTQLWRRGGGGVKMLIHVISTSELLVVQIYILLHLRSCLQLVGMSIESFQRLHRSS